MRLTDKEPNKLARRIPSLKDLAEFSNALRIQKRAAEKSNRTTGQVVGSSLGMVAGMFATMLIGGGLATFLPISTPMEFFFALSGAGAGAVAGGRLLRFAEKFTSKELDRLQRALDSFELAIESLEQLRKKAGESPSETLQAELDRRALDAYDELKRALPATKALPSGEDQASLPEGNDESSS